MLPIERQQKIMEWLQENKAMKISELSERLHVSEMTIYRDTKPLIEEGRLLKTKNGVMLYEQPAVLSNHCSYCKKLSDGRLAMTLIKKDQSIEALCCAHCAVLRYFDIEDKVDQLIGQDFLTDVTISGKSAVYILSPDLDIHCCEPRVLMLGTRQRAERLQLGFGGEIGNIKEINEAINKKMNQTSSPCCPS
ncbi:DeoR family transcriptional regulator [Sinobaca sp. H24]|uniref:DeoR family transcriptional regulator n=1 Tax=Sinobaca sp. H24 TaxID=2923376 RepID=UPI002079D2CE|nr:DeoR family transcriptional regulator [Sinobaca sp. H24]